MVFIFVDKTICNVLLSALPKKRIHDKSYQTHAHVRARTRGRDHSFKAAVLKFLHWLCVCFRINSKVLFSVFDVLTVLGRPLPF